MPPSRHPMKKHICSCCTIELVNTGTWNIRNPRKSSFAKMFRNLVGSKQVESDFSLSSRPLFFFVLESLSTHAFDRATSASNEANTERDGKKNDVRRRRLCAIQLSGSD